ncbi:MAG: ISNCY family transposase [Maribacter sp.]|nr:ISNCY family transposase [Maribacter sp.]
MRKRFDEQNSLFTYDIADAQIPIDSRDATPALFAALKMLWTRSEDRKRVLNLLDEFLPTKRPTGRKGLDLWQILVLAQCRLCLNISYDRLHYMANQDILLRHLLGIRDLENKGAIKWGYQRIYDNVTLLSDDALKVINTVVLQIGHDVFKKKETDVLDLKTDSFAVLSNVHFPTDYNLLWDSARKSLDTVVKIIAKYPELEGWRKMKDWLRSLKNLSRALGQVCSGGGKNKEQRVQQVTKHYLDKCTALYNKLSYEQEKMPKEDMEDVAMQVSLTEFMSLMAKHIDLVDRRLLQGEKIPHQEKLFSIFEQYTEWISKGKLNPELGKNVAITTDQFGLIIDYEIMESQSDSQIVIPLADRILVNYEVGSWSFDKGFWHKDNKAYLIDKIEHPIMPKKGKPNKEEQEYESNESFKKLRNKHSAVESNINELEHRGLDRCPDRTYHHFKRYIGLGVLAYNLHKIGKELLRLERERIKKEKNKQAKGREKLKGNIARAA